MLNRTLKLTFVAAAIFVFAGASMAASRSDKKRSAQRVTVLLALDPIYNGGEVDYANLKPSEEYYDFKKSLDRLASDGVVSVTWSPLADYFEEAREFFEDAPHEVVVEGPKNAIDAVLKDPRFKNVIVTARPWKGLEVERDEMEAILNKPVSQDLRDHLSKEFDERYASLTPERKKSFDEFLARFARETEASKRPEHKSFVLTCDKALRGQKRLKLN